VTELENNKLRCQTSDQVGNIRHVEISYYFPTKAEHPFPEVYESIKLNNVYFITGTFVASGASPLIHALFLCLPNIDGQMSAIVVYKQPIYAAVDFAETTLGSLIEALPQMFLTISGVARISSKKLQQSHSEVFQPFLNWKYHVGEFTQWINGKNQVYSPTLISIDFVLNCKEFTLRLYFDTAQPNYVRRVPTNKQHDLLYVVCSCPITFEDNETRNFL
jgi:hypothetical protein